MIEVIQFRHKQLFYNIFSQIYPKYSDQIAPEPFMDNWLKVVNGHSEKTAWYWISSKSSSIVINNYFTTYLVKFTRNIVTKLPQIRLWTTA